MYTFRRLIGRIKLKLRRKNHVVGWKMTPGEVQAFFKEQSKTVLTFTGFSGTGYENETEMLQIVRDILFRHSPETTIVNIGATIVGIGAAYPLAISLGFTTTGIVSSQAIDYPEKISEAVDYICFVADQQWGGKLSQSYELSPTSEAMVTCSDVLIGIGGNEVSRDVLLAGKEQGKTVHFYPAEADHATTIRRADKIGLPFPDSFWGAAHEVFAEKEFDAA